MTNDTRTNIFFITTILACGFMVGTILGLKHEINDIRRDGEVSFKQIQILDYRLDFNTMFRDISIQVRYAEKHLNMEQVKKTLAMCETAQESIDNISPTVGHDSEIQSSAHTLQELLDEVIPFFRTIKSALEQPEIPQKVPDPMPIPSQADAKN